VLTVKEKYFKEHAGSFLLIKNSDDIEVVRTLCFYTQDFVVSIRNIVFDKRIKRNKSSSSLDNRQDPEIWCGRRSISMIQKIKDFITNAITIPDKEVGWLPFGFLTGMKLLNRSKIDVIYAVGKPWTGFFIGYLLKLVYSIPLVIDFRDPWTQNPFNISKGKMLEKAELHLESFIVKNADIVIANTEEVAKDFVERLNASNQKVHVLTGGYDEKDFPSMSKSDGKRTERFVITHIGTFYRERNPANFLKAIKKLIDNKSISIGEIRINFIGGQMVKDPQLALLLQWLSTAKVLNQEPWVPHRKAIEHLYASDVLLLMQPGTYLQIPAKLYEYIFVQKPILAICEENGATDNIIKREGWGKSIRNDVDQISNAVYELYSQFKAGELDSYIDVKSIQPYSISNLSSKLDQILTEAGENIIVQ
jgi:glycosyltransferase involved in cell wall biosynthesis